jgi:hypothetical protein
MYLVFKTVLERGSLDYLPSNPNGCRGIVARMLQDRVQEDDMCMSSKGFGQIGSKNKRGLQVPNTFFWCVTQPLMNGYTSFVAPSYFS